MSRIRATPIQRFRVPLGFLFAAVFLFFARPEIWSLAIGGAIAVVGLLIRAWASGHIRKNQTLAVSGPYAYTRNPLYLGSFIMGLGFTIASGVWWLAILFALLFLGIYLPVMRAESKVRQRQSRRRFPKSAVRGGRKSKRSPRIKTRAAL